MSIGAGANGTVHAVATPRVSSAAASPSSAAARKSGASGTRAMAAQLKQTGTSCPDMCSMMEVLEAVTLNGGSEHSQHGGISGGGGGAFSLTLKEMT
eukprot:3904720-Rhodomonas_salina.1